MITRRDAVFGMSLAVFGSAAPSSFSLLDELLPGAPKSGDPPLGADADTIPVDDRLSRDIARVAFRDDSEEGVPVFLACINLVPNKRTNEVPRAELTSRNMELAAEIRENAAAWQRLRPHCPPSDVAHLIQVLAIRDLASGRKERSA